MNGPAWRPPQRTGRSLFAALCAFLAVAAGCSGGGGGDSGTPSGPQAAADDDFLFTASAALSEGQLTLNNHWTQADLDSLNISAAISYEGLDQPVGRVRAYTILVQEYRVRRKQCEGDFNELHLPIQYTSPIAPFVTYTIQDRKCYPTLTSRPAFIVPMFPATDINPLDDQILHRYGYYSGGGFPPELASNRSPFRKGTPEPLDPVDYCSRLHDQGAWGGQFPNLPGRPNECGILMCLYKASGLPANVMALLPDVETARGHWYGNGLLAGAAIACPGIQPDNAPPPVLGP